MTGRFTPPSAPRVAGSMLGVSASLVNGPIGAPLAEKLFDNLGITSLRSHDSGQVLHFSPPLEAAKTAWPEKQSSMEQWLEIVVSSGSPSVDAAGMPGCLRLAKALEAGEVSAAELAECLLKWNRELDAMDPPMRVLVALDKNDLSRQARLSDERRAGGQGVLGGIPVAVKDELDLAGYPTTVGTRFLGSSPAEKDAEVVGRLREAGAVMAGKANMHEIGLGVTGINPHHGACRNPYDPERVTGGSSSGPAAAVACGMVPLAVGADGGGSIRIPAALCGVVGLKPTFGRMSEHGAAPLCWSVAHVGPIGLSASDCAIGYLLMAGPDEKDPNTLGQPPVHLEGYGSDSLEGTRIGVVPEWFEFADDAVVRTCSKALDRLKDAGAEIVETDIPSLELVRPAHLVIIVSEMASAQLGYWRRHRNDYAADTRMNLALARRLHAYDYIQAQRVRLEICSDFAAAFEKIDLLATPATGCTAPRIRKDALKSGESDLVTTERIMRFAPAANLTGLPAISFPVGYDDGGMPVGLQLMARAYEEHLLLRVARLAEEIFERRLPKVYRSLLA